MDVNGRPVSKLKCTLLVNSAETGVWVKRGLYDRTKRWPRRQ